MVKNITEDLIFPYDKTHSYDKNKAGSVFKQLYLVLRVMKEDLQHRVMVQHHANCRGTNK